MIKKLLIVLSIAIFTSLLISGAFDPPVDSSEPKLILDPDGHTAWVGEVIFTNDEKFLITCSADMTVKVWDVDTGICLRTIRGFIGTDTFEEATGSIGSIAISPDDKYLAVCGAFKFIDSDGQKYNPIRIYDFKYGNLLHNLLGHKLYTNVSCIEFSNGGAYLASGGSDIELWDVKEFGNNKKIHYPIQRLLYHVNVSDLSFSHDDKILASCSADKSIAIWDIDTWRLINTFPNAHNQEVRRIEFSPDSKFLATSSLDGSVKLWNAENLKYIKTVNQVNTYFTDQIKFMPDNSYLVFGGVNYKDYKGERQYPVYFYNLKTNRIEKEFTKHTNQVFSISFSKSGRLMASTGGNNLETYIYDSNNLKIIQKLESKGSSIFSIAYGNDGKTIYFNNENEYKSFLNRSIKKSFSLIDFNINLKPDNKYNKIYDNINGKKFELEKSELSIGILFIGSVKLGKNTIYSPYPFFDTIRCYSLTPDGKYGIIGSNGGMFKVDADTGEILGKFEGGRGRDSIVWALSVSPDGKRVISGSYDQIIRIYNVDSFEKVDPNSYSEFEILNVQKDSPAEKGGLKEGDIIYSVDNKYFKVFLEFINYIMPKKTCQFYIKRDNKNIIINLSKDQRYFGINIKQIDKIPKNFPVVSIFISNDNEYLIWTPDNYYMGNKKLFKYLGWHINQGEDREAKFYPFDQFDLKYNRPDIIMKRLGFVSDEVINAYYKIYQKRLKTMGFTEDKLSGKIHIPNIHLTTDIKQGITNNEKSNLTIKASDSEFNLDRINIYINDVPIYGINGISIKDKKVKEYTLNTPVNLICGKNKIQVSVLNSDGAESLKDTIYIECSKKCFKHDLYIATIGISKYLDVTNNLTYADKDATDIIETYRSNKDLFDNVYIVDLNNEQGTKLNILKKVKEFYLKGKSDDYAVLFIAGHGLRDVNNEYYFATYDIDFGNPSKKGLAFDELDSLLDAIPQIKKMLLMDTCFSGESTDEDTEIICVDNNDKSGTGKIKTRDIDRGLKIKRKIDKDKKQELLTLKKTIFSDLRKGTGAIVITSSSGMEVSYEGGGINNGLFSYSVISGLKDRKADKNKDGRILASELMNYVYDTVTDITKGIQNPTMRRENIEFDYVIY